MEATSGFSFLVATLQEFLFFSICCLSLASSPTISLKTLLSKVGNHLGCISNRFTELLPKAVSTTLPGELVDEPEEQRPELYAVPITPPNLSINGNDVGLRPMSLEDFRKKISSFQDSDRWKEFNTDEGVIENERADILADRIHDLLSYRKQKFV